MTTANARANAESKAELTRIIGAFKGDLADLIAKHDVSGLFANVPPSVLAAHMVQAAAHFAHTVHATEAYYAQVEAAKTQPAIEVPPAIVGVDGRPL